MKLIPAFCLFALLFSTFALAEELEVIVDLKSIAGKTESEVSEILGPPMDNEMTRREGETIYGPKKFYQGGSITVVFIENKADWISIFPSHDGDFEPREEGREVPYSKEALAFIGLEVSEPTFENEFTKRWEPCGDFQSLAIFPFGEKVWYFLAKVATK